MILGDVNARSKSWWNEDITSNEGLQIDSLTITYGLLHLILDPTHILSNSSIGIDLIFKDQPNLAANNNCSSIPTHKIPSPNKLLHVQPYH